MDYVNPKDTIPQNELDLLEAIRYMKIYMKRIDFSVCEARTLGRLTELHVDISRTLRKETSLLHSVK